MGVVIMFPTTCYNQLFNTTLSNQIKLSRQKIGNVGDSFYTLWCEDEQLTERGEYLEQSARKGVAKELIIKTIHKEYCMRQTTRLYVHILAHCSRRFSP